jgi:ABC-type antimicrobial peptide transport system permease subunit
MALGAMRGDILRLVMGFGTRLVILGIGAGTVGALALTRLMTGLLFEVSPSDPLTFSIVAALLTLVSLVACYIPTRRAMRVDPVMALRYE